MVQSRVLWLCLVSGLLGCANAHPVEYAGVAFSPQVRASEVEEFRELPGGFDRLGSAKVNCNGVEPGQPLQQVSWLDVVCSREELVDALRERAAAVGATALVQLTCNETRPPGEGVQASCKAGVAAPRAELVRRAGIASPRRLRTDGIFDVTVDLTPVPKTPQRPPIPPEQVRERPVVAPPFVKLAAVTTRCERCTRLDAEVAARSVVAHLGGSAIASLQCSTFFRGWQCQADALAHEQLVSPIQVW